SYEAAVGAVKEAMPSAPAEAPHEPAKSSSQPVRPALQIQLLETSSHADPRSKALAQSSPTVLQLELQPSPSSRFPSSQASLPSTTPFPRAAIVALIGNGPAVLSAPPARRMVWFSASCSSSGPVMPARLQPSSPVGASQVPSHAQSTGRKGLPE